MPRKKPDELPPEVQEVVQALLKLARYDGITRSKVAEASPLLALVAQERPHATVAEQARVTEEAIRTHVNSVPNLQDRALLVAGLNLEGDGDSSALEARITSLVYSGDNAWKWEIDSEGAVGRFRSKLLVELAWRLLGGAPTFARPRPPSSELDLAVRLRRQGDDTRAVTVLEGVTKRAGDKRDTQEAWCLLATIAYESGDYDAAEAAFSAALELAAGKRGGKLAMAIDRYARKLTDEEAYERAIAIVRRSLSVYFEGRWLWRRYGCIKWYSGDLLDAYSALTHALNIGYPASRIFHARGQVLAELGQYDRAIAELSEALRVPRSSLSIAVATSARAFAMGMSGELEPALTEFRQSEVVIPDSGWLHYWRALCLLEHGESDKAALSLRRALIATTPALNRPKRERAEELMAGLSWPISS